MKREARLMMGCVISTLLCGLMGCAAASLVAVAVTGPPVKNAAHIPAKRDTLVLVENYKGGSSVLPIETDMLANLLANELTANDVVPVISHDKLVALKKKEKTNFKKLTIAQIGQKIGAKQVLYVDLLSTEIEGAVGSNSLISKVNSRVKWIDVETGKTIWPSDPEEGYPLNFSTPQMTYEDGMSDARVRSDTYRQVAVAISQLFYTSRVE